MAYQSPIPIRASRPVNPFAVFLEDIPETTSAEIDLARAQAEKQIAQKSRTPIDFASIFSKGVIGGLQTAPDLLLGPASEPSQYMRGLSDTWGAFESPQYKAQQALQADEFNALGPDASLLDKGLLAGKHALTDPLGTAAMAAGNLAPFALGGAAGITGKAGAMGLSGVMGGGAVRGGIYDAIQQAPDMDLMSDPRYAEMRKTMPEVEAKNALGEVASSLEESYGKIGLGIGTGIASGAIGAEAKALSLGNAVGSARNQLIRAELEKEAAGGLVKNFLRGAAEEGLSEFPEEGSQQYLSNVGAAAGGAKIDPWANVAESAVQAGIAGALGGGFSHGLTNLNAKANLAAMNQEENAKAKAEGLPEPYPTAKPVVPPKAPVNGEVGEPDSDLDGESGEELSAEQIAAINVIGPLDDEIAAARAEAERQASQGLDNVTNVSTEEVPPAVAGPLPADGSSASSSAVDVVPVVDETLPPAETVDSVVGAEQNPPAVEAPPGVQAGGVGPNGTIEPIRRLREQIKKAIQPSTEPTVAEVPVPASAVDNRVVDTQLPATPAAPANDVVSGAVSAPAAESDGSIAAPEAPVEAKAIVHEGTVAQPKEPVKAIGGPLRGGDTVMLGDLMGTVHSHPLKGMVNVTFEDGTVKRVKISEVKKIATPPVGETLEVVPEPTPRNHVEILKELRSAIPDTATNKAEFDKAALEYQNNPTPDNLGAVLRQAKKAGLEPWAPGEAFSTAIDALKAGKNAFEAVRARGISEASAKAVVKKAEAYMARMAKTEDVDIESQLRASIEAAKKKPQFQRDTELTPEEFAQQQMDEYHRSFEEDMATRRLRRQQAADSLVQPGSLAEKAVNAFKIMKGMVNRTKLAVSDVSEAVSSRVKTLTPQETEDVAQNWNGVNDENRAEPWDNGAREAQKIEGTKFKVADFEGDVDKSVIAGLTRFRALADSISSVAARVANTAGLKTGTFAGFSPNGNFAGVTWRGRVWLNPLKHLGFTDNASKMASRLVKTLVHEMIHTNGFGPHDAAFHAEFERVMAQIQLLIKGMEFEIGKTLDKETIKRLRGLNGTAEKGWSVARQKGRDASVARRQSDSSVSSIQSKAKRDGNLPPPDSETKSGSRTSEGNVGKAEGVDSASKSGRATEATSGKADGERSGVLKPEFVRDGFSLEKDIAATEAYGRGNDSYRTPASYKIIVNGEHVGFLRGSPVRYMGTPRWTVSDKENRPLMWKESKAKAEEYISRSRLVKPESSESEQASVLKPEFARAFHGTPHKFDKFKYDDTTHGTGEGAQAYGDGLYFAESKEAADFYRKHLSEFRVTLDGKAVDPNKMTVDEIAERYGLGMKDAATLRAIARDIDSFPINNGIEGALDRAKSNLKFYQKAVGRDDILAELTQKRIEEQQSKIDFIEKFRDRLDDPGGNLYEIDIPDDVVDRMLDWDKPLNEQPQAVQSALAEFADYKPYDGAPIVGGGVLRIVDDEDFGPKYFMMLDGKEFRLARNDLNNLGFYEDTGNALYSNVASKMRGASFADLKKLGLSDSEAEKMAMNTWESGTKNASKYLDSIGIPGIKYLDGNSRSKGEGSRNFVVFNDKNVTILTRNGEKVTGQEKIDAIEQMQEQHPETAQKAQPEKPQFAREAEEDVEADKEIELPQVTDKQRLVYNYVNKHARIGEMLKAVQDVTGKKADVDLEEAATAASPQTAAKIGELRDYHVRPMMKLMGESKISIPDAEAYIHAKAAGEDVSEQENGPSGEAYKAIDNAVLEIIKLGNAAATKSGMKAGKVSVDPEGPANGIIQRAIDRTQKIIVKAAENTFRRQVAKFLSENISPDWAINPKNQEGGHTVSFQVDGKKQRMWFKDKVLASQIESLSDGETSYFMNKVRQGTRVFANVNTRLSPVFPIKNFIRDLFFGLGKVYVDDGPEKMMAVLRGIPEAFKDMIKHAKDPIASKGTLAHEMFSNGGMPAWFGLPSEENIRMMLEADIKEFDGSKSGKAYIPFKRMWNALRIFSEASEGATRLAYFKVLKESGVPMQEAIKKTRGVTGDFQKHGSKKNMRYAYAFFNSSIQGADAMVKLTKELRDGNPRARNLAMFLVAMGMSQALVGMGAGDDDKDGQNDYEQLPEYLKNANLILPVPGHPIAIPLPYGLNVPIVAGMGIMRSLFSDEPDKHAKSAMNMWQAVTKSFNPMGDEASLMQLISPTLLDPLAQSSENIDSLGRKIVRDRYQGEENLPDSEIKSRKDSEFAKTASSLANKLTGGSRVKPGLADVSPATIDNTVAWAGGSMLRFMKDLGAAKLVGGKWTGNVPIFNDFVKTPKSYFYTGRFWDQLDEIRSLKDSARQLDENARKEQLVDLGLDPDRVEAISRSELRKNVKLTADRSDKLSKEVQQIYGKRAKLLPMYEELRKQISALNQSGDPDAEDKIEALVKAANRKYMEATR